MMQDDFDQLMKKFESDSSELINIEEVMGEVLHFFAGLKSEILNASPDEREAIFSNLSGMYTKLMSMSGQLAEKMGISEQELLGLAEDMKHFTPAQQKVIEKTKAQMMSEVEELGKVIQGESAEGKKEEPIPPVKKEPDKHHHKGPSRSRWMRS